MDEKFKHYDEILAKLLQNINVEDARDEGIYINGYNDDVVSKTYMKMAEAYADMTNKQIILLVPLFTYWRFILTHWKVRKRYKWTINFQHFVPVTTPLQNIAEFVANYFGETIEVYEDIYKEFYA